MEEQQKLLEECQNCLLTKMKMMNGIKNNATELDDRDNKPIKKELENLYQEFGLLYRVYKPSTSLNGTNKLPYWPFICERCGVPLKEDLDDPGYRSYAWRFASYCINGNLETPSVKFDFDTTNLKIQILNADTPKFVSKLKLMRTKTQSEGDPDILKDLDIYSLAESPHLWDEIDPFGIKRYIFIADLWGCSIDEIEKRQIQLQEKHSSASPDFR